MTPLPPPTKRAETPPTVPRVGVLVGPEVAGEQLSLAGGVVVPMFVFHTSCPFRLAPCSEPLQSDQKTMLLATIGWAKLSTPPPAVQCTFRLAALAVVSPVSAG